MAVLLIQIQMLFMFFGDEHYYDDEEGGSEVQVTTATAATETFLKISSTLATSTAEAISSVLTSTEPTVTSSVLTPAEPTTAAMAPIITMASSTQDLESSTVPIFQVRHQSATPDEISTSILNRIAGVLSGQTVFDGGVQTSGTSNDNSSAMDDLSTADLVVLAAGSFYVLASINRSIRQLYSFACYRSDPRLIELGYVPQSIGSRVWGWAAKAIEKAWVPIWFDHRYLRDGAVTIAINDKFRSLSLEELLPLEEELEKQGRKKRSNGDGPEDRSGGGDSSGPSGTDESLRPDTEE